MTANGFLRSIVAAFAALALLAPAAQAVQRYAAATSSDTTGDCPQAAPCRIDRAVAVAGPGDEVIVAPGDYAITYPVSSSAAISIHGVAGQPRPRLVGAPSLTSATLDLSGWAAVSHLYIEANGTQAAALSLGSGLAENLILYSSASASEGQALSIRTSPAGTLVRNTVARSASPEGQAVSFRSGPLPGVARVVHVTAIGESATTAAFSGNYTSGSVSIVNSIGYSAGGQDVSIKPGTLALTLTRSVYRPGSATGAVDGGGNLSAAPLFADAAARDYHQAAGSPTIDAGMLDLFAGPTDIDGEARVIGTPDIGADEFPVRTAPSNDPKPPAEPGPAPPGEPARPVSDDAERLAEIAESTVAGPAGPVAEVGVTSDAVAVATLGDVPVSGDTIGAAVLKGSVLVRRPGGSTSVRLKAGRVMPVGTLIDARYGTVALTTARNAGGDLQTGRFWGGRFVVKQARDGATRIKLIGGDFSDCPVGRRARRARPATLAVASASKKGGKRRRPRSRRSTVRSLWGSDKGGRYSTHGRDSVATVRGTKWLTRDRCDGTLVRVMNGSVVVRPKRGGRAVVVEAGRSKLVLRARSARRG